MQFDYINYIQALGKTIGIKMAYLQENLYEILGKKYNVNMEIEFSWSGKKKKRRFHILEMPMVVTLAICKTYSKNKSLK